MLVQDMSFRIRDGFTDKKASLKLFYDKCSRDDLRSHSIFYLFLCSD